jgi:tetratricopeptide (TPR) repeat protein
MRTAVLIFFLVSGFLVRAQPPCDAGINRLPMYGHVRKCKEQLDADHEFLLMCGKQFKTRTEAAQYMMDRGWTYFYEKKFDDAMKRFNQAWLLDSLDADVYWGYGNIAGDRDRDYKQSLVYFEQSLAMSRDNPRVWESAATSYGKLFFETKDVKFLNKAIAYLKTSLALDPKNARACGQLTGAYCYFIKKDSARKYLALTDKLDPSVISPEIRKMLRQE